MVKRDKSNSNLMQMFNNIENEFDPSVLRKSLDLITEGEDGVQKSLPINENPEKQLNESFVQDPFQPLNDSTDLVITDSFPADELQQSSTYHIPNDDIIVKKEVAAIESKKPIKNIKFTNEEDNHLKKGILKYGRTS